MFNKERRRPSQLLLSEKKKKTASGWERHLFPFLYSKRETPSRQTFLPSKTEAETFSSCWTRTETPSILRKNDTSPSLLKSKEIPSRLFFERQTYRSLSKKKRESQIFPSSSLAKIKKKETPALHLLQKRERHLFKTGRPLRGFFTKKKHLPSPSWNKGSLPPFPSRPLRKKENNHPFPFKKTHLLLPRQTPSLPFIHKNTKHRPVLLFFHSPRKRKTCPSLLEKRSLFQRKMRSNRWTQPSHLKKSGTFFLPFWGKQKKDLSFLSSKRQERPFPFSSLETHRKSLRSLLQSKNGHLPFLVQKKETTSHLLLRKEKTFRSTVPNTENMFPPYLHKGESCPSLVNHRTTFPSLVRRKETSTFF